jgi:hypothetical protein
MYRRNECKPFKNQVQPGQIPEAYSITLDVACFLVFNCLSSQGNLQSFDELVSDKICWA